MKQTQGKSQKFSGRLKVFVMGTGLAIVLWGAPLGADTGPFDTGSSLFSPGEPMHRMAPDPHHGDTNILLARGGGGGRGQGKGGGGGSGQCDGSGSGQGKGKGYGAKNGTGTPERPQDGTGYGAGSGKVSGDGSGQRSGK